MFSASFFRVSRYTCCYVSWLESFLILRFVGRCFLHWLPVSGDYANRHETCMFPPNRHTYTELHQLRAPRSPLKAPYKPRHCVMRPLGKRLDMEHHHPVTQTYITHLRLLPTALFHTINNGKQIPEVMLHFFKIAGCCIRMFRTLR